VSNRLAKGRINLPSLTIACSLVRKRCSLTLAVLVMSEKSTPSCWLCRLIVFAVTVAFLNTLTMSGAAMA
jgi:hypothetical protein